MDDFQFSYGILRRTSCGYILHSPHWTDSENTLWYGSLWSPKGSGGNFDMCFYWSLKKSSLTQVLSASETATTQAIQKLLQKWDHVFLNESLGSDEPLTPEVMTKKWVTMCQNIETDLSGARWTRLSLKVDDNNGAEWTRSCGIRRWCRFQMRSAIGSMPGQMTGVDVLVTCFFQYHEHDNRFTSLPLGDWDHWRNMELPAILQLQTLDQWLQVLKIESLPEKLFGLLSHRFANLIGVEVQGDGTTQSYFL